MLFINKSWTIVWPKIDAKIKSLIFSGLLSANSEVTTVFKTSIICFSSKSTKIWLTRPEIVAFSQFLLSVTSWT